jgi:hypothetical protein
VSVFFRWHGLGSGAKFVFLKSKIEEQSRSYGPELGGRWILLRKLVDQRQRLVRPLVLYGALMQRRTAHYKRDHQQTYFLEQMCQRVLPKGANPSA